MTWPCVESDCNRYIHPSPHSHNLSAKRWTRFPRTKLLSLSLSPPPYLEIPSIWINRKIFKEPPTLQIHTHQQLRWMATVCMDRGESGWRGGGKRHFSHSRVPGTRRTLEEKYKGRILSNTFECHGGGGSVESGRAKRRQENLLIVLRSSKKTNWSSR